MANILQIKNLNVSFNAVDGIVNAVRGVSLSMNEGEILALVGESGCGKSVTAQSILRLNDSRMTQTTATELRLDGEDILSASEKEMRQIRGNAAGMVFQDPSTCLNPTMKIGKQITESLLRKKILTGKECEKEAIRLLTDVHISDPVLRAQQYPHQLSGGMRQRVMIAMALASSPKLIIADEPTTALDVTVQLQILRLLKNIRKERNTAILLITHDLSVVANIADRVAVMYAGEIVEEGDVKGIFANPAHPYTKGLLDSIPVPGKEGELHMIPGTPPDLRNPISGCAFAPRCSYCRKVCMQESPTEKRENGRRLLCFGWNPGHEEEGEI